MTNWNKYFKMIIRRIWIVVLITLMFVSIASYISLYKIKPQYEASTRLIVMIDSDGGRKIITYDYLMANEKLVKDYQELIKNPNVTAEVIKRLQLSGMTDEELADRISIELIPDTSVFRVLVQYENPVLVVDIANEVSNVLIQKSSELLKVNNLSLVNKANGTQKPISPRPILIIGYSFLIGIVLSLSLILVLVYFDDTVGNSKEIKIRTGLLVVGVIPDMKMVGAKYE